MHSFNRKYSVVFVSLVFCVFLFSCAKINPSRDEIGYVEGTLVEIKADVYGIEGYASPANSYETAPKFFSKKSPVRFKLYQEDFESLLEDGYKPGTDLDFVFSYVERGKALDDWSTTIRVAYM